MATPDNLPLRDLQNIILGERTEPLSVIEIRNLFSYPTTPESILYIITALNRSKIDPNTTLVQGISNANRKEDLVPIALSLRYGADPNLYVNFPSIGDIHILGFVYLVVSYKTLPLLNALVIMLMAMGSDPNKLIFDTKGGIIKDEYSLVEPLKGPSVLNWLEDQGYDTIIPQIQGQNYTKVEKDFMTTLATFLDKPELIPTESIPRLNEVIGSHSGDIFSKYVNDSEPNIGLKISRDYINVSTYEKYVDLGAVLNYGEINDMILSVKKYKELGDIISIGQIREMLLYSITRGMILDQDQVDLIKEIDPRFYTKFMEKYSVPYWIKACNTTNGKPHYRLKQLSYQLNLYPEAPKDVLCYQIKLITQADPDMVKQSVITRQQVRIKSDVAYINQFDNGDVPPDIKCNNRSLLGGNLYDYPDADIAYYRDYQDSLWCFTSNNFLKMVDKQVNPYTNQLFPQWFLDEINRKIEFISKYRSMEEDPTPISIVIDNLNLNDTPDNTYNKNIITNFNQMLIENNLMDNNIKNLSIEALKEILKDNFGISINLDDITREHAEKTFSIVSYQELLNNPSKNYFKQIEERSINKNTK